MSPQNASPAVNRTATPKVRDLPGCIKFILLFFLLILLIAEIYAGEFRGFPDLGWIIWSIFLLKLLLIVLLVWLIWVQRTLNGKITSPVAGECATEEIDIVNAIQFIRVKGTASGTVFGHYTLALSGPYPYTVLYPAGGGTVPVNNGELGRIDTTALSKGDYIITLTVFPIGAGSPITDTVTFTLLKVAVYITHVGGVPAVPNWFDPGAELVVGTHTVSLGGGLHVVGSAYVYTCVDRKVERYEIRYARVAAPGPEPAEPLLDAPIPADWPAGNLIHPPVVYDPSKYWSWTEIGPAPMDLIKNWITQHFGAPSPGGADYPCLATAAWNSVATSGSLRGGRYVLLLIVTDTQGHRFYDSQRIWLDNWPVQCTVTKLQRFDNGVWNDLPDCTDILMSWKKLRIIGVAWDALIDSAWSATAPNDNFDSYALAYAKEFVGGSVTIATGTSRVPAALTFPGPTFMPTPADADELAVWDLTTLDAGPSPTGKCEAPLPPGSEHKLWRNCACTYNLMMGASDKTVEEGASSVHHPSIPPIPLKIINDL